LFWIEKNLTLPDSVVWGNLALFVCFVDREESCFARFCCLGK
jgi:hypothetical protein